MEANTAFDNLYMKSYEPDDEISYYTSVEIPVKGLGMVYQYRLLKLDPMVMTIMIREDSAALAYFQISDRMQMKYYTTDSICPFVNLLTEIRAITFHGKGRFRGHYLVDLDILEEKDQVEVPWHYHTDSARNFPFVVSVKPFMDER